MTLDTKMTVDLMQELFLALRANDAECFKEWLALGLERLEKLGSLGKLGRLVVNLLMQHWMSRNSPNYLIPIKHYLGILITKSELSQYPFPHYFFGCFITP